ncbi:MAG: hypothetical protein ACRCVX_12425 [Shewanella sp.]
MAITSFDPGLVGSVKQTIPWTRTGARTTIASAWYGMLDVAGSPGGGVLAGASTTAGVVPTDATAGFPVINSFAGGAKGYLAQVEFGSSLACRIRMNDMLFKAGAFPFNATQALTAQPSYASRAGDYKDTQIWFEAVTTFTGNPTVTVTYTNQDGVSGRVATLALGLAPIVGRRMQLPLQAGDVGVQLITNVTCTVATVGTFNVLVLRKLWSGRVRINNDGDIHGPDKTMIPVVFSDSAIDVMLAMDSTTSGVPDLEFVIASG